MGTGGHLERQMKQFWKMGVALALGASMIGPAMAAGPEGIWQFGKESNYQGSFCGKDGKSFCLTVNSLWGGMDTAANRAYMGRNIIDRAKPAGQNRWKGKLDMFGQRADATVILKNDNTLVLHGCMYIVACKDLELNRTE